MKYEKCLICGEYGWDSHKCNPEYYIFTEDQIWSELKYGFAKRSTRGTDAENAAINYCEKDYELSGYLDVWVISRKDLEDLIPEDYDQENDDVVNELTDKIEKYCKHFEMESELTRNYYAKEIK